MALADTGYWLALANRRDRWHDQAVSVTRGIEDRLVVTWPVLAETCHLMLARLGVEAELRFWARCREMSTSTKSIPNGCREIHALMEKYRDLPMDLADASLVLAANDLGDGRILSTDRRDFGTYRWKEKKPFRNLLVDA